MHPARTPTAALAALLALGATPPARAQVDSYRTGNPRISPEVLVVRDARAAVVCVEADLAVHQGFSLGGEPRHTTRTTTGSGVVVYEDGYIVTNYHVVAGAVGPLRVRFDPEVHEDEHEARLLSFDADQDLALLKVEVDRPLQTVRLGTSSDVEIGERVLVIGNSYGKGLSVSSGIVSGLHRNISAGQGFLFSDLIQTDASINPGTSGGPLLNMLGELIGITTVAKIGAENMGYAIPVDTVARVLQDQLLGAAAARAWFGFEVEADAEGLLVAAVVHGGPAGLAGLLPGDRPVAFAGEPLRDGLEQFQRLRAAQHPGRPVRLEVVRDGRRATVRVQGWNRVDAILFERLGLVVGQLAIGRRPFVQVLRVDAAGAAAELGLRQGDVIDAVRLQGHSQAWSVESPLDLAQLVASAEPGTQLSVDILRDDNGNGHLEWGELYKGSLAIR